MREKAKKSRFVGLRMTAEQEELLVKLKEAGGYKSQTDVLLSSLQSMASSLLPPPSTGRFSEAQEQQEVMRKVVAVISKVDEIVDGYRKDENALIQILLDIQQEYNWLPREALLYLSERLGVPLNRTYQIATFYKAFNLVPRGRHLIRLCTGTACHVRGAGMLLDKIRQLLRIEPGETSPDLRFTLETVNCLGCCALGPVVVINEEYHSNPATAEMEKLFAACE